MRIKLTQWAMILLAAILFSGCESIMKKEEDNNNGGAQVTDTNGGGAVTGAASRNGVWQGNPLDNPDSPLYTKVIYFDFDVSDIRPEFVATLRAHAEYLLANPTASLSIEGHCDERGSREYNIGLGERRASALKRFMEAEGVPASQINTISYGEERPADAGHGEAAWAMNRRGVLVY